jgi:hypothetical protein
MIPPSNAGGEGREVLAREVDRLSYLLFETWKRVDPTSGVAKHPVSYMANFADMARAVIADRKNADDRAPALVEAAVAEMRERAAGHRWITSEARKSLRLVEGCLECNADDERRWRETIEWLEALA